MLAQDLQRESKIKWDRRYRKYLDGIEIYDAVLCIKQNLRYTKNMFDKIPYRGITNNEFRILTKEYYVTGVFKDIDYLEYIIILEEKNIE